MTQKEKFTIKAINSKSPYLKQVIELGDKNSATLGFFPHEAYQKAADNENVLICLNSNNKFIGYLLYNVSSRKNIVKLTHLCIKKEWRGKGVARLLLDQLETKTQYLTGIMASCRSDYNLAHVWSSLGFTPRNERQGKRKKGSTLVDWWRDYGNDNLLTQLTQQNTELKLIAAIDANIFYDLVDEKRWDEDSKESQMLMANWLESEIELCITDEIYVDIQRNKDAEQRRKLREIASGYKFQPLQHQPEEYKRVSKLLRRFFPSDSQMKESDYSDLRHLAKAITSKQNVQFFITRDTRLLEDIEDDIYQEFNLRIIRPVDLILKLDELRKESEYQPRQLAGTKLEQRKIKSEELGSIVEEFLNNAQGERKSDFNRILRQLIVNSKLVEGFFIIHEQEKIGFIIYDRQENDELRIPIFRMKQKQITSTLIRHFLLELISTSANEYRIFTRISDDFLNKEIINALQEDYFLKSNNSWIKMNLKLAKKSMKIANYLDSLCRQKEADYYKFSELCTLLKSQDCVQNSEQMFKLEKFLYPAKIIDADIPTFIIPIQYWYAKDLFDAELATEVIWGAKEDIALRRETVYYKAKSGILKASSRILWYVSKSKTGKNSSFKVGAIRACSRLDQVIIDKPHNLYSVFKRLGIYDFTKVMETANNDSNKEIMAIKFSDTELFENPIDLDELKRMIPSFKTISLQAPQKISNEAFITIYNKGRNLSQ